MYVIHPDRSSAYGLSGIRDEKREPGSGQGSGWYVKEPKTLSFIAINIHV